MVHYTLKKTRLKPVADAKHADDKQCPDGGWRPLTKNQKARLSLMARDAFRHQRVIGMTEEEWRHEVSLNACGYRISEATQKHWSDLKAAFLDLAGKPEAAFRTHLREGDNKRRVALHKLTKALEEKGLHTSYAEQICRTQFKVPIAQASAKQLWCLFYTVTNRRKS